MSTKSILDYEVARERLQQLEQDQVALAQLVTKLRKFSDDADAKTKAIDARAARSDELVRQGESSCSELQVVISDLRNQGDRLLNQLNLDVQKQLSTLNDTRQLLESGCKQFEQEVRGAMQESAEALEKRENEWRGKQDSHFRTFSEEHLSELTHVTKAYDRQKVVFDNVKVSVESLATSLEEHIRSTESVINDQRSHALAQFEEVTAKLGSVNDEIRAAIGEQLAPLAERSEVSAQAFHTELCNAQNTIVALSRRMRRQSLITIAAFFVAIALAVYSLVSRSQHSATITQTTKVPDTTNTRLPMDIGESHEPIDPKIPASDVASQGSTPSSSKDNDVSSGPPRIWTDATGRTVEAFFVAFDGASVQLRKSNGKVYSVPIKQLSKEDQEFVEKAGK